MWAGSSSYQAARPRDPVEPALWGLWQDSGDGRNQVLILKDRIVDVQDGELLLETTGEVWKNAGKLCVRTTDDEGGRSVDCSVYQVEQNGKRLRLGNTSFLNVLGRSRSETRQNVASLSEPTLFRSGDEELRG